MLKDLLVCLWEEEERKKGGKKEEEEEEERNDQEVESGFLHLSVDPSESR